MASEINDGKIFIGSGLDSDSDLLAIEGADSRYRMNVILSEDANEQVLSNVRGNIERVYDLPNTGDNIIKGFVEDKENKAGIYFIHNSLGRHRIVRFNSEDNSFTTILGDNAVLLPAGPWDGFVDAGLIGNEDEQFLVWADGRCLHMINIDYAISGGYNLTITEEEISFYKRPLTVGNPSIYTSYPTSSNYNYDLRNKIFQFAIRLKYYDKTFSVLSSWSEIDFPMENIPSGKNRDDIKYEYIKVEFDIQNEPKVVDKYQLLFRIVDIGEGAMGDWHVYDEYDYTTKGPVIINFKNEKSIGIVESLNAIRPYDYVPDIVNRIAIIDTNRIVLDVGQEGYGNLPSLSVTTSVVQNTIPRLSVNDGLIKNYIHDVGGAFTGNIVFSLDITIDYFLQVDLIFSSIRYPYGLYTYGRDGLEIGTDIRNYFMSLGISGLSITNNSFVSTYPYSLVDLDFNTTGTAFKLGELQLISSYTYRTLKTDVKYKFGVEYGYNGKRGPVQTSDDFIVSSDLERNVVSITGSGTTATVTHADHGFATNDFISVYGAYEDEYNGVFQISVVNTSTYTYTTLSTITASPATGIITVLNPAYNNYYLQLYLTLNHAAPAGATDFRIVSFGSNINRFEEYVVAFNYNDLSDNSSKYTIYLDGNYTVINRTQLVNRMRKAYGDENIGIPYGLDFQVGDEIRFIGYFEGRDIDSALYNVKVHAEKIKFRIDVVTSTEIKCSGSALRKIFTDTPDDTRAFWLIQILQLKENFSPTAQEFSLSYPIANHNSTINITNYFADTWKSKQVYMNQDNYSLYDLNANFSSLYSWMEKDCVSLYYPSRPSIQGRTNVVNEFSHVRDDRRIRWGGQFIDESGVNFLTKFDYEDERSVDDRNGPITKIQQIGNVLKVYQERKVTSFYLKTTSSIDADGNSTFVFSSDVMSVGRQSIEDYGCTHFTSYVKNVRNAYFFDIVNGAVIRDSANGFQEISSYKMRYYFKQKSKSILSSANTYQVLGGWDEALKMYIISFVNLDNFSDPLNETLAFHEPSNRWISFFSFVPEYYGKISGDQLLSFRDGALYEHNISSTRNNFYGSQYNSEVWVHFNKEPVLLKVYNVLETTSVGLWYCPDTDSIVIERPIGMQSRLILGKFKKQEGIYRSEFMRDMLSGGSTPTRFNLFNGRQLRGQEMTIKLRNTDTTKALLESVLVQSSISK